MEAKDKKKNVPDITETQKALIKAAERAAQITSKFTGKQAKPAYNETNVPGTLFENVDWPFYNL